jgi:hypothetical protein
MKISLILVSGLFYLYICPAQNIPHAEFSFCEDSVRWIKTPKGLIIDGLESDVYEESGNIAVVRYDLNNDGNPEYFIKYDRTKEGNCEYVIIDGKTLHPIGDVGGLDILITEGKRHGFQSIITFLYSSIDSRKNEEYEYNGKEYQPTKSFERNEVEMDSLLNLINSSPRPK